MANAKVKILNLSRDPVPLRKLQTKEIECSLDEMERTQQRPVISERFQIYQYVALILCQLLDAGG
jgi:hypothetical protein